ncbi:hypothetical protein C6W91_12195 [Phaeobacter sp. SYSU ZJ3003]
MVDTRIGAGNPLFGDICNKLWMKRKATQNIGKAVDKVPGANQAAQLGRRVIWPSLPGRAACTGPKRAFRPRRHMHILDGSGL